jgi:chromosome segregation ATPase
MYIFGGRTQEGVDLGDLAAFRITSRRWYMFQNMGHSPSPRSGHSMTAFGKHIVVLAGEPSSSASDRNELSLAYILDTSKIRYPPNESAPPQQALSAPPARKMSGGERSNIPQGKITPSTRRESMMPGPQLSRPPDAMGNVGGAVGSRLPRAAGQPPPGPPPLQQPPQPRVNGALVQGPLNATNRAPIKNDRAFGPPVDTNFAAPFDRENMSPATRDSPVSADAMRNGSDTVSQRTPKESMDTTRSTSAVSRNASRSHQYQLSQDSVEHSTPKHSMDMTRQRSMSRDAERRPIDSGMGASPATNQQTDELLRDLERVKSRNAWYASELALARKAGYNPTQSTSPSFDERSTNSLRDEDKPLLEALFRMKSELERVQSSISTQGEDAAKRIAEVERQRDAAVSEAIYAKTKLAAHGGSQAGTPQPDSARSTGTPDMDRIQDINRRLAASLAAQGDLSKKLDKMKLELDTERKAKQLAEDTAEAAQNRVQELDSTRQKFTAECESLRAGLHEAERIARETSANAAEADTSAKLLAVDKQEMGSKLMRLTEDSKRHMSLLQSLREAVAASSDKTTLLETKLEEEKAQSDHLRQKLAQLRTEHEMGIAELETATQKLHDAEELAEKHAEEARLHRNAVMTGLDREAEPAQSNQDAINERVAILQRQVDAANSMARKNQAAADQAADKLRRAEERIAGLESYQEQSSREGLTIRKQLQQSMRDIQASEAEKADIHHRHERLRLDSNAVEVQLKSLRNLLEERGVNPVDARRSRVLDSPSSRFGTPELNRVRELEQQIDSMNKAHDELKTVFEQREHNVSKDWEEKLQALHNDHQAAVKYLRGTEKMLTKMKQELDRYKTANSKLEEELEHSRSAMNKQPEKDNSEWEAERTLLRSELAETQERMKASVMNLEKQLTKMQSDLAAARHEAEVHANTKKQIESSAEQTRLDLESLRRQNAVVEERAREAESRVQMFLDQFETSVDSYRRQSQLPAGSVNGEHRNHRTHDSVASAESFYSNNDDSSTPDATRPASSATRNSMALDNLASELDALRSHWETTNKAYRLSDRFEFEKAPSGEQGEMADSLSQWRHHVSAENQEGQGRGLEKEKKTEPAQAAHPNTGSAVAAGMV